jgi:hypothetical protein
MEIVTGEGQIKKGDKLHIIGKNTLNDQHAIVKDVITIGGNEEVILDKKSNRYFITKLVVTAESWVKQVCINNTKS